MNGRTLGIAADLGTEAGAHAVIERFPAGDILINNLGIFEPKPFEQIPDDDWRRFFEGQRAQWSAVEPSLHRRDEGKKLGTHCVYSSESGLQIPVEMIHYRMSP